jgi:hypothetical protein
MDQETVTEIRRHFDVVAEGLGSEIRLVDEKADRRSEDLERRLSAEMQDFAKALRTEVRLVDEKADRRSGDLEGRLSAEMQDFAKALRTEIHAVDEKADRRSGDLEGRLRSEMQDVRRHFDVVGEGLRSDIRLVAEGVAGLDEKSTLEFVRVREEIGEVKSLLQVSYGDLDRRVQALERKPS